MAETEAQKALAREVARLDREARGRQVTPKHVRCPEHGPQYACLTPGCGHTACARIRKGACPECPVSDQETQRFQSGNDPVSNQKTP